MQGSDGDGGNDLRSGGGGSDGGADGGGSDGRGNSDVSDGGIGYSDVFIPRTHCSSPHFALIHYSSLPCGAAPPQPIGFLRSVRASHTLNPTHTTSHHALNPAYTTSHHALNLHILPPITLSTLHILPPITLSTLAHTTSHHALNPAHTPHSIVHMQPTRSLSQSLDYTETIKPTLTQTYIHKVLLL